MCEEQFEEFKEQVAELNVDEEPDEDSNDDQIELLDTLKQNGTTQL